MKRKIRLIYFLLQRPELMARAVFITACDLTKAKFVTLSAIPTVAGLFISPIRFMKDLSATSKERGIKAGEALATDPRQK